MLVVAEGPTYVFSHDPAASKPVATLLRPFDGVNTAAFQVMVLGDASSNHYASVRSLGATNPLDVWLTNTPAVTQAGQWTFTGSVGVTPLAPFSISGTVVASVVGTLPVTVSNQVTVTASLAGIPAVTVTGSVVATQGGAPWTFTGCAAVTQATSPWGVAVGSTGTFQGFTVASVVGQPTVTASVPGTVAVTQATSPWVTQAGSSGQFLGFVVASVVGGGSQVTVTNSIAAAVSQISSPWIVQQGSTGQFVGFVVASVVGGGSVVTVSNTPTVNVLQVTSPWIVQAGSTGQFQGFVVASIVGGGSTVTGSVWASQANTPWLSQLTSGGQFVGFVVASIVGGGTSVTGSVLATQGGAPWSIIGSVGVTQQTSPWITQGGSSGAFVGFVVASIVGGGSSITGSVWVANTPTVNVLQVSSPWMTQAGSTGQFQGFHVASVVGNVAVTASVTGQLTVTASIVGTLPITGTVTANQGTSPWVITGSAGVTQLGAPWSVIGSANVQGQVAHDAVYAGNPLGAGALAYDPAQSSVSFVSCGDMVAVIADRMGRLRVAVDTGAIAITGQTFVTASIAGVPSVVASCIGQQTVTASIVGQPTVTASIPGTITAAVTQTTSPWIVQQGSTGQFVGFVVASVVGGGSSITGSVWVANTPSVSVTGSVGATVSQVTSPWIVLAGSSGAFQGFIVTSVIGNPTVVASIAGVPAVTVTGSVVATQGGAPWSMIGSVSVTGSVGATITGSIAGTVVASVVGQVTVTASIVGVPTVVASCIGQQTVTASVIGNPTVIASVIGNATVTASVVGQPTMTASVIGQVTVTASIVGGIAVAAAVPTFTPVKIAWEVQSSLPYPYDGTAIVRSSGTGTVALASTVLSSDLTGLAFMFVSSCALMGQVRQVTGWSNQQSRLANVSPAWTTAPSSGTTGILGIDVRSADRVQFKTEVASAVSGSRVYLNVGLWSMQNSGNTSGIPAGSTLFPQNLPVVVMDATQAVDAVPVSFHISVPSYWQAEAVTVTARGHQLVKVYVSSANMNFSMWGVAG